jgi:hypothetical protein
MGTKTGRTAGFCAGFGLSGYANPVPGGNFALGCGRGRGAYPHGVGGGRGWRNMFYASGLPSWARGGGYGAPNQNPDPEREKQLLKRQAEDLQSELDVIKKRLAEVESDTAME